MMCTGRRGFPIAEVAVAATIATFIAGAGTANADPFRLNMCQDRATRGWSFYCTPPAPPEEETTEPAPVPPASVPVPAPPPSPEPAPEYPATDEMMAFRKMVDEIKYRAVLEPTVENVQAYMEVNKLMADKAGDFTETWQRILFNTPDLSALTDYPMAEAGIGVYQDQIAAARQDAFQEVARTSGILFLFEDESRCGICKVQGEILAQMEAQYDVAIFAVAKDGGHNSAYPGAVADTGRLAELGLADYPAPTLALARPDTREIEVIGSGLLTADDILERVFVITKVPEGARY